MADNITDVGENLVLDHMCGTAAWTPTGPLKLKLMTANGTDSAAGTELGTSGGYTAGGLTITFSAASGGSASNSAQIQWTNMPVCTIVGAEIWDSHGTPKRLWYGPLAVSKTFASGDSCTFPIASVVVGLA